MEVEEVSESLNEWEMVVEGDIAVFPPSHHEGIQVQIPAPSAQLPPVVDSEPPVQQNPGTAAASNVEKADEGSPPSGSRDVEKGKEMEKGLMRSRIVGIATRVCACVISGHGFWSCASVAVATAVVVLCLRLKRWQQWFKEQRRDRPILLIKEKDQKIRQLLLQVAQMKLHIAKLNEMLLARRKVPVLRVG